MALMGFTAQPAAMAESMIGAQFRAVDRMVAVRILLAVVSIAFVLLLYWSLAPLWMLAGWSLVSTISIVPPIRAWRVRRQRNYEGLRRRDLARHAIGLLMQGLLWAGPMILIAPMGDVAHAAALWTMTTCLIAAVAMGFFPTPLAAVLFLVAVSGGAMAMMLRTGSGELAATVASFAMLMLIASLRQARGFGRQIVTDSQLAEKRETVSMLLREYDDSRADWLWRTDNARRLTDVTPQFARMMGIDADAIEGQSVLQVLAGSSWSSGEFDPALRTLAERLKAREAFANLVLPVEVDGTRRWWELSASPRTDERGVFMGFHGVGSDVTVQQESAARIAQLAKFDTLTTLPNRLHLTEALEEAVAGMVRWQTRSAFLMIDLDRFKSVNDTLGHHIGDRLLAQVAERLRAVCARTAFCGRLGGDEFAVIIPEVDDPAQVERLAVAIIARLSQPYEVDHHMLFIGASIGSATGPRDGRNAEALIRSADLAMYRAKDEGGGKHFAYVPTLHADAEVRRKMELALRGAIERGEMRLEYQPVVDAHSGELASFESLLRWNHPEFGEVPPAKFIRLAEEARLIGELGAWVLRVACAEAASWPVPVGLSLNLSPEQLCDQTIIETLKDVLATTGLPPERLELEVTESIFMREGGDAVRRLEEITALGVQLALDDFGTGYSSLGYLSRTRFRTIKIDRSFVTGAALGKPECVAIITAVVALAKSLGMQTTAEGVETEKEFDTVRDIGCGRIQGYYFGRSMKTEDVHRLFDRHRHQAA